MAKTPSLTVRAQWVGPYGDRFVDGTVLVPNETVCEMPRGEAELSDNWKVLPGAVTGDEPQAPSIPHALAAIEAAKDDPATPNFNEATGDFIAPESEGGAE